MECRGIVGQNPAVDDRTLSFTEGLDEVVNLLHEGAPKLGVGDVFLSATSSRIDQVAENRSALICPRNRSIEGQFSLGETLLHGQDVVLAHVEALREEFGLDLESTTFEFALLLVQAEEELALGPRGSHAYQPDVVDQVLQDVGANPVDRV